MNKVRKGFFYKTRPFVNNAKDWLDQLFLFPDLDWICDEQTNDQQGDPSASLLLSSQKGVFCNTIVLHYAIGSSKHWNHLTFNILIVRWEAESLVLVDSRSFLEHIRYFLNQ